MVEIIVVVVVVVATVVVVVVDVVEVVVVVVGTEMFDGYGLCRTQLNDDPKTKRL